MPRARGKYRLAKKLTVHLEERRGEFSAWAPEVRQYGIGPTPATAMRHLWAVLLDYYEMLEKTGMDGLGPLLQKDLRYLRGALQKRKPDEAARERLMGAGS